MNGGKEIFDAVVIGSGFGGTISALSLANKYQKENDNKGTNKRVCILERGQWWISHELNFTPKEERKTPSNMREYLDDNKRPYHFWAHPDNVKGVVELASATRQISRLGLYDYRVLGNVHVITASGVGGGSLVYSNVTLEPDSTVVDSWEPDTGLKFSVLKPFLDKAREFIGVNKITTNTALSINKLEKTKVFEEAGNALHEEDKNFAVDAIDLSITDIPAGLYNNGKPPDVELEKLLKKQNNVCERQGRCNLGCIPGARHTLNKKLVDAISPKTGNPKPIDIRELCEVYDIEYLGAQEYKIRYFQYHHDQDKRDEKEIIAKLIVISAGSLGSSELLWKCQKRGHLKLSKKLGSGFVTNGDLFAYMKLKGGKNVDITRGPINTSHISFKKDNEFRYTVEDTTIPKMVAPIFSTILELRSGDKVRTSGMLKNISENMELIRKFGFSALISQTLTTDHLFKLFTDVWKNKEIRDFFEKNLKGLAHPDDNTRKFIEGLITFVTTDHEDPYASPEERLSKFFIFSCMGRGEEPGNLSLVNEWEEMEKNNSLGEKLKIEWDAEKANQVFKEIIDGLKKIARKINDGEESEIITPLWDTENTEDKSTVVLHPLGGCNMAKDIDNGVVSSYGEVFMDDGSGERTKAYPGLYVIDGSIVPDSIGVNPSLTISAIALRAAAEKFAGTDNIP